MGLVYCSVCKNLFNIEKGDLCPACAEIEAVNIKKITDYLQLQGLSEENHISAVSLSEATGIEVQEIERLYRTDKLRRCISSIDMTCRLCGNSFRPTIFTGFFCKNCSSKVEKIATELKESGDEKLSLEEKIEQVIKTTNLNKRMHIND